MGAIADAANLPSLPDSTNSFSDVANADAVANDGIQTVADNAAQQKQAEIAQGGFNKITHKWNPKTGKYDVQADIPADTFDYLQNLISTGKAAQDAFSAARMQLAQKRVFQEQNPIVAGIGKIASTAAAQYGTGPFGAGRGRDISPIIRAAGAYGLDQFGETPAQLSQQEAGLQAQEFGVANQLTNQFQQQEALKRQEAYQSRSLAVQEGGLQEQIARDKTIAEQKKREDIQSLTNKVVESARANRNFSDAEAAAVVDQAKSLGYTPEQATALVGRAKAIALASQVKWDQDVQAGVATDVRRARLKDEAAAKVVALKTDQALTLADAKLEGDLKKQANAAALKAASSGVKVSENAKKAMVQMDIVEKNLNAVRQLTVEHPEAFGLIGGTVTKATSLIDPTASGVSASVQHLFAQLAKGYGGARGFSKVEQPVFKDLAGSVFNDPEALGQKLDKIQEWVDSNRKAWLQVEPGLQHFFGPTPATAPAAPNQPQFDFDPNKGLIPKQ